MGLLAGIAMRDKSRAPMQLAPFAQVTRQAGLLGDYRGMVRPGKVPLRQVSLLAAEDWAEAMALLGADIPWQERRANLLTQGLALPRRGGVIIAIGADLRIETTGECDPCQRMNAVFPGLQVALRPFWRGGLLGRVVSDGAIAVGDEIRIG